ncbi:NUDIX domain-containing protein [Streptomyces sp. NPDC059616]|uniref:NUDIX domain-containing protein n=1 Tax=Streptomyces sp. NPDC059616 TaxID=3346886 RepID=UPI00369EEFF9
MSELVEHVDEHDRVLGIVEWDEAVREKWLHRIAATICRDREGRILVLRRAETLSRFPGYYDAMVGGAVDVGESYEKAAVRELAEELDVRVPVRFLFKLLFREGISPIWLGVHEAVVSETLVPDSGESALLCGGVPERSEGVGGCARAVGCEQLDCRRSAVESPAQGTPPPPPPHSWPGVPAQKLDLAATSAGEDSLDNLDRDVEDTTEGEDQAVDGPAVSVYGPPPCRWPGTGSTTPGQGPSDGEPACLGHSQQRRRNHGGREWPGRTRGRYACR